MARKALKVRTERLKKEFLALIAEKKQPKFPTRVYNRCRLCGRKGGYMRRFEMCRICFREHACAGKLVGVKKSSW